MSMVFFQIDPLFDFILKESISNNFPEKVSSAKTLSDFGSEACSTSIFDFNDLVKTSITAFLHSIIPFCPPFFLMVEDKVYYQAKCKICQHLQYHQEIPLVKMFPCGIVDL